MRARESRKGAKPPRIEAELQHSLRGTAEFETMEGWLSIRVAGDGHGHMDVRCVLRDQPGVGNSLEFTLASDQSFMQATLAELAAAVEAFPVVGVSPLRG